MTELERRILAAEGYIELGLHSEAREELSHLPPESAERADVIELIVLCSIHAAYCLHELGQTQEALDLLARGPAALRTKPVYYYNVGCYLACLGENEKALQLLEQSFEMDGSLRDHARNDRDLDGLRQKLEKI